VRVTRSMLTLHWFPPLETGGSPVERYLIEKREADRAHWLLAGKCVADITTFCITDLLENHCYYFRVVAENAYGRSLPLELNWAVIPKRIQEFAPAAQLENIIGPTAADGQIELQPVTQVVTEYAQRSYSYTNEQLASAYNSLELISMGKF